jgi:hypothetical protein
MRGTATDDPGAGDLRAGGPCPAHSHDRGPGPASGHGAGHDHSPGHGHDHGHAPGHDHGHSHGHGHSHDHGPDPQGRPLWRPHTPPGEVPILDIGGDVGALIVYLPALTATGELDIQPVGEPGARFHTGVHERGSAVSPTSPTSPAPAAGSAWVAIYPEVVEGRYELLDDHGARLALVAVAGGEVRELDLR